MDRRRRRQRRRLYCLGFGRNFGLGYIMARLDAIEKKLKELEEYIKGK